jgi:hypothetical protein
MSHNVQIRHLPPETLTPYKNNARTHSEVQINLIAASIKEFGFKNPVLVDENNRILAGHGRVMAAIELGLAEIPVICHSDLTEAQKRAYILADNRIAEKSEWDVDLLKIELGALAYEIDLGFDLEITGFNTTELDIMLSGNDDSDPDDDFEGAAPDEPAVTQPGMIWQIGPHRLICGDSLKQETYDLLLEGEKADMVFSDPPYNVKIDGHVGNSGKIKHREFQMASGEMTEAEFIDFLTTVFKQNILASRDGSIHFNCIDWGHVFEMLTAGRNAGFDLKNICAWVKDNGGMGSFYADPPKSGQFKPGKSGNPKGRPKGSKNLKTLVINEAYEVVEIFDKGKKRRLSQLHVMLLQLKQKALKGDLKAIDRFFDLLSKYEDADDQSESLPIDLSVEDEAILRGYEEQFRKKGGKGSNDPEEKDNNND